MFTAIYDRKLKRGPQVVTLKDAAFISALTGVQSGDRVLDAGSGSGWLSCYLGSLVAPTGKIYSYEWRPDFADFARKNVKRAGLDGVVEVREKNVFEGIEETDLDLITLDLANSEQALPYSFNALKDGAWCVGYLPHAEQLARFVAAARLAGFSVERNLEVIVRDWLVREQGSRPENMGLVHTAFLSFLRKNPPAPKKSKELKGAKTE